MRGGGAAVGAGGVLARLSRLLGQGVGGGGRLFLLLGEEPRRLLGGGDGRLLVPLQALPQLRQPRREARRGGADEEQGGDQLPGQQLTGPDPGTRPGTPTPDSAALTSTSTQAVNCAQASQTMTVRMCRKVCTVISRCSQSRLGAPPGNGHPAVTASANGTPTTSPASTTKARNALTKSPNVRRRTRTG
ncbi:hypothetical protein [Streptomyces sp. 111WW2]|uniref:hypothetical protein n=1 Tax=Streptomyces sp. 111WW2 TaxID=1945515 RepID=UPI00406C750D